MFLVLCVKELRSLYLVSYTTKQRCFAYLHVCYTTHVCSALGGQKRCSMPWVCSSNWLWAIKWVLRIKLCFLWKSSQGCWLLSHLSSLEVFSKQPLWWHWFKMRAPWENDKEYYSKAGQSAPSKGGIKIRSLRVKRSCWVLAGALFLHYTLQVTKFPFVM